MRGKKHIVELIVCATVIACGSPPATPGASTSAPVATGTPGATQPTPTGSAPGNPGSAPPSTSGANREPWTFSTGEIRGLGFAGDGTAYVFAWHGNAPSQVIALDPSGAVKSGWPQEVGKSGIEGDPIEAPNGDVVVLAFSYDSEGVISYELDRFAADGTPRDGWPYGFASGSECGGLLFDDAGNAVVTCDTDAGSRVVAIDANGDPAWDTPLQLRGGSRLERGTDGTLYVASSTGDGLVALGPDGTPLAGWPVATSDGTDFVALPSGRLLAWWHDGADQDICHGGGRTVYTVVGADGAAKDGWPQSVAGYGSAPAVGPDGSIYVVDDARHAIAFGPDGAIRDGWPARVSGKTGSCFGPPTPSLASDGTLFVVTGGTAPDGAIEAIGPDGRPLNGWPLAPDAEFAYPCRTCTPGPPDPNPALTAGDRTYVAMYRGDVAAGADVVALNRSGAALPGWPAHVAAGEVGLRLAPDGRLFAILTNPDDSGTATLAFLAGPG
jgi:hypothetical protein